MVDFAGVGCMAASRHWAAGGNGAGQSALLVICEALCPVEVDCPVLWVEDGGFELVLGGGDVAV